jgi:hypothetical protein
MKRIIPITSIIAMSILLSGCEKAPDTNTAELDIEGKMQVAIKPNPSLHNTWVHNPSYCDGKLDLANMFTVVIDEKGVRASAEDNHPASGHWMTLNDDDKSALSEAVALMKANCPSKHQDITTASEAVVYHTNHQKITLASIGEGAVLVSSEGSYYLTDFDIDTLKTLPIAE